MRLMILGYNKVLGIKKSEETFEEIKEKHLEEAEELTEALENGDVLKIAEETMDVLQVCIGILDKLDLQGVDIEQIARKHNKKLVKRHWVDKGDVIIKWSRND